MLSRRPSAIVRGLAPCLAALAVAGPVLASPLTAGGPSLPSGVINTPPLSPVTNPGPATPPGVGNITPPSNTSTTPPVTTPGPAGTIAGLPVRHSPEVLDLGQIATPSSPSLFEHAAATVSILSPSNGAVTAAIHADGKFWVKRLTSYRWVWSGNGTQRIRVAEQTVAGGGTLPVLAGQELEVEVAFTGAPGDAGWFAGSLSVSGFRWDVQVPVRIAVTDHVPSCDLVAALDVVTSLSGLTRHVVCTVRNLGERDSGRCTVDVTLYSENLPYTGWTHSYNLDNVPAGQTRTIRDDRDAFRPASGAVEARALVDSYGWVQEDDEQNNSCPRVRIW
jgi:CARDB protein